MREFIARIVISGTTNCAFFRMGEEKNISFAVDVSDQNCTNMFTVGPNEAKFQSILNHINYFNDCIIKNNFVDRHSSVSMGRLRGWNRGVGHIFRTRPDLPWVQPSLLHSRFRVVLGGKIAGGTAHPSSSSEVKEMYPARSQWGKCCGCCSRRDGART